MPNAYTIYIYIFERKKQNQIHLSYQIYFFFFHTARYMLCLCADVFSWLFHLFCFLFHFQSKTHENTEQTDGIFIWIKCSIAAKIICCRIIMLCVCVSALFFFFLFFCFISTSICKMASIQFYHIGSYTYCVYLVMHMWTITSTCWDQITQQWSPFD